MLVTEDQLSLAIGRRGQNVRLASKLVGWDIEIMTHDELAEAIERAERWFGQLPHASAELTSALIEEGFLSYNDLTFIDAQGLAEFSGLTEEQSDEVVMYAEEYSDVMEQSVEEERRQAEEAGRAGPARGGSSRRRSRRCWMRKPRPRRGGGARRCRKTEGQLRGRRNDRGNHSPTRTRNRLSCLRRIGRPGRCSDRADQ